MLAGLFGREERAITRDPVWDAWGRGDDVVAGANTTTGVVVSSGTVEAQVTVYTCVSFIADAISALPVEVYRGADEAMRRPRWLEQPNPERTWQEFAFEFVWCLLLDGNAYVLPIVSDNGQVSELWMLHPSRVRAMRDQQYRPVYQVSDAAGQYRTVNGLYHVRDYPIPGEIQGMSRIDACRESFGLAIGMERSAGSFFGNGSNPSGVIEAPGSMTAEQASDLKSRWERFHRGVSKQNGIAVLSGGATYKPITITPDQAQFLESRNFNAAQIAALFKLPPELAAATLTGSSSLTYSNITERWNELVRRWLPWIRKLERLVTVMLPGPGEQGWRAEIDTDEYANADIKTRYEAYKIGVEGGWLFPDEIRAEEQLPPREVVGTAGQIAGATE